MADKEKKDQTEAFITLAKSYWEVFKYFIGQSGDVGQALTLTREMFIAICTANNQAPKKESDIPIPSDFWDELGG